MKGPHRHQTHWMYFPEEKYPFYRVGFPSNVESSLCPEGCSSMCVEVAHRGTNEPTGMKEKVLAGLDEAGLLHDRGAVVHWAAHSIPVAYVLFDHAYPEARRGVLGYLQEHGIIAAGRYGKWVYSSMEDALVDGRAAAWEALGAAEPQL